MSPVVTSPGAISPSDLSSSTPPGLPAEDTQNLSFYNACGIAETILVRVTSTATPNSSASGSHYVIASVTIENYGTPLHYGPADFHFVASDGQVFPVAVARLPESKGNALAPGTLLNAEVRGTVTFDVPSGAGQITYQSEAGGHPFSWAAAEVAG
jgi:hypothetical protein